MIRTKLLAVCDCPGCNCGEGWPSERSGKMNLAYDVLCYGAMWQEFYADVRDVRNGALLEPPIGWHRVADEHGELLWYCPGCYDHHASNTKATGDDD